jgi:hypothetical protein
VSDAPSLNPLTLDLLHVTVIIRADGQETTISHAIAERVRRAMY